MKTSQSQDHGKANGRSTFSISYVAFTSFYGSWIKCFHPGVLVKAPRVSAKVRHLFVLVYTLYEVVVQRYT